MGVDMIAKWGRSEAPRSRGGPVFILSSWVTNLVHSVVVMIMGGLGHGHVVSSGRLPFPLSSSSARIWACEQRVFAGPMYMASLLLSFKLPWSV